MLSDLTVCIMLHDGNPHSWRILTVFEQASCNLIAATEKTCSSINQKIDILLIDSMIDAEFVVPLAETTILFDVEDAPERDTNCLAYAMLKDKVDYYAKLCYSVSTADEDNIESVSLPLPWTLNASTVAKTLPIHQLHHNNAIPVFFGSSTFLTHHSSTRLETNYLNFHIKMERKYRGINSMPVIDDKKLAYNQRIDWLAGLQANHMPYVGGLVAGGGNLSLAWQTKHFGDVECLFTNRISYNQLINQMARFKIHLAPAGHSRWGPRLYDSMATGGVLICTELSDSRLLHPPQFCMQIDDHDCIAEIINVVRPDLSELIAGSKENVEYLKTLTPDKIVMDFLKEVGVND